MLKNKLGVIVFLMWFISQAQECPQLSYPLNGATDIPVSATITWPAVAGINGYLISLGTTPGGEEILSSLPIGVNNFYAAPTGLPENTQIYVTIGLVLFDAPPIICSSETFTTIGVTSAPPCTFLIAPDDNASNVTIVTDMTWAYAPGATG